ncbi:hypothetical protein RND81_14G019400 [Saponaria officinalis]|uniref:Late embryogenesis abundant protein LEA-2 subgroup domain-containing protein n=1 Tax=Saponaria officinalis TaxID=3572 RepID=A0AAW1GHC6_SAPOF
MSEPKYPRDTPPVSGDYSTTKSFVETPPVSGEHHRRMSQDSFASSKMSYATNPGTYVIQVPKDQIYRVPPPENAHKFNQYTKRKTKRSCCRCCICSVISTLFILIILLGVTIGVLYLVYNPKVPSYAINSVHVKGVNLTVRNKVTPDFNVTVKTNNPNGKISIYYEQGSKISVYHDGLNLCNGELPAFYQPPKSVTVFSTEFSGPGFVLSKSARDKLRAQEKKGEVPLEMDVTVPVKIKAGSVKFWLMSMKVKCDVTVTALTGNTKVVSQRCKVDAKPW